jgi:iron complex outermembrane receptor protein
MGNAGTLTPRIDYSYLDSQFTTLTQEPRDFIPSRGVWNAQLSYASGQWRVQAFATNLADKTYVASQFNGNEYFFGNPRQYGVRLAVDF